MSRSQHVVAARIRGEIEDLDRAQARALLRWEHALRQPDEQEAYLESTALNLQSMYTGIERIFVLIADRLDGRLPESEVWHRELLSRMAQSVPGVRPSVISPETAHGLDDLMRFRHLVRHIYAERLLPSEMAAMMQGLPGVWRRLKAELGVFADLLSR